MKCNLRISEQSKPALPIFSLFNLWILCSAAFAVETNPTNQCLRDALATANSLVTVAELRLQCPETSDKLETEIVGATTAGAIKQRLDAEAEVLKQPFVLTAHRPNYFLPYTYNSRPNETAFRLINPDRSIDSAEAQFQVSFKFPVAQRFLEPKNDVFFAFTSRAWWQAYNKNISSPFRETDYEPELFLRHSGGPQLGPIKVAGWDLGLAHQSNGQSQPMSRSWNRVNANIALETHNLAIALRSWYRIPESGEDDDNPHLHRFLGYGDARLLYRYRSSVFSAMVRPGTEKSAFELTWSLPLWQQLRLYLVYFDGYGESLLDYNRRVRRIGIGVGLNDYLESRNHAR